MRIFALLSWWDELSDHLTRCVRSLDGFADVLVAVDGRYETFPDTRVESPSPQHWALSDAARRAGLDPWLVTPRQTWASEVEKRAAMFEHGRLAGATSEDWFLIIDADMELASFTPDAKDRLAVTDLDTAEVNWHDVQVNGVPCSTHRFRSMFRALPGLTVERTHFLYTVPVDRSAYDTADGVGAQRRFLWHTPDGHISPEPALDLTGSNGTDAVTLHHYNSGRDPDRKQRALDYYADRDERHLESAGDWR